MAEFGKASVAITEFAENFYGVFAELGGEATRHWWCAVESHGRARETKRSGLRVFDFDHHAVRGELRIFDGFLKGVYFGAEHALGFELGQPRRGGSPTKTRREERVQFGSMRLLL